MERAKQPPFKLFNARELPLIAAYFAIGILSVLFSYYVAVIVVVAAAFSLYLLFRTKSIGRTLAFVLAAVCLFGYGAASLDLHLRNNVGLSGYQTVNCRVIDVSENEGTYIVVADKMNASDGYHLGKIRFETDREVSVGDRVEVDGEVSIRKLSLTSLSAALAYRKGAKYEIAVEGISATSGTPPLSYTVKEKVRSVLFKWQGEREGAFTYAMFFGDADAMFEEDKSAMREVGVAHVFAVSGLHVGVLSAAILFLLRKLKVKDKVSFFLLLPFFGFYAYLVGFTPSVLRAAIMVSIGVAASALGERYDDLSALSLAAISILLAKPLYLFDVSFLMSFLSIFGIQALARPIERGLLRKKCRPKLASGLALSLSATIGLLPLTAMVFGKIPLVGVVLNLLVVPLASVAYVLSLVALLPTLVVPSFGHLLGAARYIPLFIVEISARAASLGLTAKYDFSLPEVAVYYATVAFVGKYSLAKRKVKVVAGGIGLGVLTLLILAV